MNVRVQLKKLISNFVMTMGFSLGLIACAPDDELGVVGEILVDMDVASLPLNEVMSVGTLGRDVYLTGWRGETPMLLHRSSRGVWTEQSLAEGLQLREMESGQLCLCGGYGRQTVDCIDADGTEWQRETIDVPFPAEGPFIHGHLYPRQLFPSTEISSDGAALAAVQIHECPDPDGYPCAAQPVTELSYLDATKTSGTYIRSIEDFVFQGGALDARGGLWLVGELEGTPSLLHIAYL